CVGQRRGGEVVGVGAKEAGFVANAPPRLGEDAFVGGAGGERLEQHLGGLGFQGEEDGGAGPFVGLHASRPVVGDPGPTVGGDGEADDAGLVGFAGFDGVDGRDAGGRGAADGGGAVPVEPVAGEQATARRGGLPEVEGGPDALADILPDAGEVLRGAATGRRHCFPGGSSEGVRDARGGDGGDVHHPPRRPASLLILGQHVPGEVVLVPTGLDDDHGGAGGEAGLRDGVVPVEDLASFDDAVGFGHALEGVVDDEDVCGAAGQGTADADGVEAAAVPGELPCPGGGIVVGELPCPGGGIFVGEGQAQAVDERGAGQRVLCAAWIATKTGEILPQSVDDYQQTISGLIIPRIGEVTLVEATPGRIATFLDGLPESQRVRARTILSQAFALALSHDAVATNPVRPLPKKRTTAPDVVVL